MNIDQNLQKQENRSPVGKMVVTGERRVKAPAQVKLKEGSIPFWKSRDFWSAVGVITFVLIAIPIVIVIGLFKLLGVIFNGLSDVGDAANSRNPSTVEPEKPVYVTSLDLYRQREVQRSNWQSYGESEVNVTRATWTRSVKRPNGFELKETLIHENLRLKGRQGNERNWLIED